MTASDLQQLGCQHLRAAHKQYRSSPPPRVPLRLVSSRSQDARHPMETPQRYWTWALDKQTAAKIKHRGRYNLLQILKCPVGTSLRPTGASRSPSPATEPSPKWGHGSMTQRMFSHHSHVSPTTATFLPPQPRYYISFRWKTLAMIKPTGELPAPPHAGADLPGLKHTQGCRCGGAS